MRVSRLFIAESLQYLGLPGMLGIGLLLVALGALFSVVMPAHGELERGRLAQQQAEQAARVQAAGSTKPQTRAEQLKTFFGAFPTEIAAADALQRIYDTADQNGVALPHGEYSMAVDDGTRLARYNIALPVVGSYEQIRGFIAAMLAAVPALALEHVDFQRQKIGDPRIEAKLRMTLFLTRN
jgi:Tfp pilus assembly protein PilO